MNQILTLVTGEAIGLVACALILIYLWFSSDAYAYLAAIMSILIVNSLTFDSVFLDLGLTTASGTFLYPCALAALAMCASRVSRTAAIRVWRGAAVGLIVFILIQMKWVFTMIFYGYHAVHVHDTALARNTTLLLLTFYIGGWVVLVVRDICVTRGMARWLRMSLTMLFANLVTIPINVINIEWSMPKINSWTEVFPNTIATRSFTTLWCVFVVCALVALSKRAINPPRKGRLGLS